MGGQDVRPNIWASTARQHSKFKSPFILEALALEAEG